MAWHGDAVTAIIEAAGSRGIADGLRLIGETSQERVPLDRADLERSLETRHAGLEGVVGYTDSKAAAAHENLTDRHDPGRRAKFLESAADDREDDIRQAIASAIRRAMT